MRARLSALWMIIGTMGITSVICHLLGTQYYHVYLHRLETTAVLPLITRAFVNESGWIYFHPILFFAGAVLLTWKGREQTEWIWCFVATTLGVTIVFLALFYLAMELPQIPGVPRQLGG